jgi:pimeloyl-ACP methyl ester carboxylesterase
MATKPTIVLIHGAWADGTSWQHVIPLLESEGYVVTCAQIQVASLADDVATAKRLIDGQPGPVVVAGHSYGGMVMTGAAADNPNVKAIVYVSAFAPDAGESITTIAGNYPATPAVAAIVPDSAGFLYLDRAKFHDVFCKDVPDGEARIMGAVQKPFFNGIFGQTLAKAAWHTVPSWFVVSQEDQAIHPDQERFYAKRMKAKTIELKSSHVSLVSHPKEVAALILEAARAAAAQEKPVLATV